MNRNRIHKYVLKRFFDIAASEIHELNSRTSFEFGCGEGFFLHEMRKRNVIFDTSIGIDIREDAIKHAKEMIPDYNFKCIDLFDFESDFQFDLVIASQVMEHLIEPDRYIEKLVTLSRNYLFLTVPWEPWFQLLNFLRGRDMLRLGNHPEHVNHWNSRSFSMFVSHHIRVYKVRYSFPFLIFIAKR